jgi:hypothetical protein
LAQAQSVLKLEDLDFDSLFERSKAELLGRADEEELPHSYGDNLFDHWPNVKHPVGYHPTCACTRARTNMRGFTSWMSSGDDYAWSIDPSRVRNMTQFSSAFGSSHLVCDAAVYGVGYEMNNLQMQSKWNPNARADPGPGCSRAMGVNEA